MAWIGLIVMLAIAWAMSSDRSKIPWRTVVTGVVLQFVFALLILKTPGGRAVFKGLSDGVAAFLDYSDAGARFVFGEQFTHHFFAFKVLSTIIFFSSFICILYHLGILQRIVQFFAWGMQRALKTSGAETLSAAANIFIGQTEAPLLIRPYIAGMTRSELMAVMTGGFATVAGGVLAAYTSMGVSAGHLIAASVMSAPAALVMAKLMIPETEQSQTAGQVKVEVERPWANVIDAAAQGAGDGLKLALNVAAMLLAFTALIAVGDGGLAVVGRWLGLDGLSFSVIFGWICAPLAYLMGVPWEEARIVGSYLGIKTVLNEFVAYSEFSKIIGTGVISEKSEVILTYALCGFANFSSIAIQIGGIGSIAPERKSELARLGLRAMVAGSLACFQTAAIAGLLL